MPPCATIKRAWSAIPRDLPPNLLPAERPQRRGPARIQGNRESPWDDRTPFPIESHGRTPPHDTWQRALVAYTSFAEFVWQAIDGTELGDSQANRLSRLRWLLAIEDQQAAIPFRVATAVGPTA